MSPEIVNEQTIYNRIFYCNISNVACKQIDSCIFIHVEQTLDITDQFL